ncbi:GGDEF domain-containing protein [Neptunicella marina]|uniref:GGDEF domain-containing protein n=1 Tax=Neptunicella marina TaxID=2125989 RepID=A0A8J6IVG0_9ALTE|nr:GGDEF domain-containing protein [Neptunicella marina]MBC3767431.1 GGDEF domain-containing protein [Neptunicella marina]
MRKLKDVGPQPDEDVVNMLTELKKILALESISSLYQPIIDKYSGEIFAYEALSRGPSDSVLHSPTQLFESARQHNLLCDMENLCRKRAVQGFVQQQLPGRLFINISPEALEQSNHQKGKTLELLTEYGLTTSQVVIELTEQHAGTDETILLNALRHYQEMGFAIALDDLGAGYSSLRLWSQARPEFVKIDRHFIENIDSDNTKQEFVRSFVEIAQSMHCKVIAEGVETQEEFEYLCRLKIDYFQGYYFCRPQAKPPSKIQLDSAAQPLSKRSKNYVSASALVVHSISVPQTHKTNEVVQIFQDRPNINSIAVLQDNKAIGIVHRSELLGLFSKPFGRDLYGKAPVVNVMERKPLAVDSTLSIDQVSRLVTSRARYHQEDDFIICKNGEFLGIGLVIDLLKQITEAQIKQARHSNPLTQLPGLVPINDCIEQLIRDERQFVVAHFDIDHFKPFNDVYGFAKGDEVILALGQCLQKFASSSHDTVGHIGGDDFIVLWNSEDWQNRVDNIVKSFSHAIKDLYQADHVQMGGFVCPDRYGESRFIPLTTLSIAAIEISAGSHQSAFEVSSCLSPLKHAAKQQSGHSMALNHPAGVKQVGADIRPEKKAENWRDEIVIP